MSPLLRLRGRVSKDELEHLYRLSSLEPVPFLNVNVIDTFLVEELSFSIDHTKQQAGMHESYENSKTKN